MSLLAPNNARILSVSRASSGEVDRYGVHKDVIAFNDFPCRLDLSPRVGYTAEGQEVTIDATIIVSSPEIELLPGDKINLDTNPTQEYRVIAGNSSQDHLGVSQFRTYDCVRQR